MSDTVIASGNLATARRTISGVLSQFALLGMAVGLRLPSGPPRGGRFFLNDQG